MQAYRIALVWVLRFLGAVVLLSGVVSIVELSRNESLVAGAFVWGGLVHDFGYRFATGVISLAIAEILLAKTRA